MKEKNHKLIYTLHAIEIVAIVALIAVQIMTIVSINEQNRIFAEDTAKINAKVNSLLNND